MPTPDKILRETRMHKPQSLTMNSKRIQLTFEQLRVNLPVIYRQPSVSTVPHIYRFNWPWTVAFATEKYLCISVPMQFYTPPPPPLWVAQWLKNPPAMQETGLIPGSGSSPGEGNGNPFQYSCLGNPKQPGGLQSTGLQRAKHDWRTKTTTKGQMQFTPVLFKGQL